jgi:uncharacterized membrane protein
MDYLFIKYIHIISSTILFGTGIGSAFYMLMANHSKDINSICFATRHVVIADWLFTTPSVIVQFITGIWMVQDAGYSYSDIWITWGLSLYAFAGICWLPVVWLQIKMRNIADQAHRTGQDLPLRYWGMNKWWISLGALAFPAVMVIFYLMAQKPV